MVDLAVVPAWKSGYSGKGVVVSVVDSNMDVRVFFFFLRGEGERGRKGEKGRKGKKKGKKGKKREKGNKRENEEWFL